VDRARGQGGVDCLRYLRVVNEGDHSHGVLAHGAARRVHMIDSRNQVAGAGIGIRGGAVCHMRAISAGMRA
jgi:hypothetical protein